MTALPRAHQVGTPAGARSRSWLAHFVLGACAATLCAAVAIILGWFIVAGASGLPLVLNPLDAHSLVRPLLATLYVVALAAPPTILIGVLAAIGVADVRIFGESAPGMRRALGALGSIPTVVAAFALLVAAIAAGWKPSLTGAAFAMAAVNMPLMAAVALSIFNSALAGVSEQAVALGASSGNVARYVLLPLTSARLARAIGIVITQMVGGVAVIAMVAGAFAPGTPHPIGAWPLAVHLWVRATDAAGYGVTAALALVLTLVIWLLQGVAALRSAPAAGAPQEER